METRSECKGCAEHGIHSGFSLRNGRVRLQLGAAVRSGSISRPLPRNTEKYLLPQVTVAASCVGLGLGFGLGWGLDLVKGLAWGQVLRLRLGCDWGCPHGTARTERSAAHLDGLALGALLVVGVHDVRHVPTLTVFLLCLPASHGRPIADMLPLACSAVPSQMHVEQLQLPNDSVE